MGYRGCMGYEALFPANQLGGLKKVWNLREYGVCEPWVMRESTVISSPNPHLLPRLDGHATTLHYTSAQEAMNPSMDLLNMLVSKH